MRGAFVSFVMLFLIVVPTVHAGMLEVPLQHKKKQLLFEEFMDLGDTVSSMTYVYYSYLRAFGKDTFGFPTCKDGTRLQPLIIGRDAGCPKLTSSSPLPACHNASIGDLCEGTDKCGEHAAIDNCVGQDGVERSVYKKVDRACSESFSCEQLAQALFVTSVVSTVLAIFVSWAVPSYQFGHLSDGGSPEGDSCFLPMLLCTHCSPCAILFWVLFCAYLLVPSSAVVLIMVGLSFGHLVYACLKCEEDPGIREERALILLEIPCLGLLAVRHLEQDQADAIITKRACLKWALRIVEDIPEVIISALDLHYFGGSWQSTFDCAMSAVLIVYYLSTIISIPAKALDQFFNVNDGVKPKQGEGKGKGKPDVVGNTP